MQHRTVPGELVVLMENVQAKTAVAGPVVHGLKGDERELLIDGQLGDGTVLHTVGPAPERLAIAEFGKILGLRLGQEDDVTVGDQFLTSAESANQRFKLAVRDAETLAVAMLEAELLPDVRRNALQMLRMDGEAPLVRLQ